MTLNRSFIKAVRKFDTGPRSVIPAVIMIGLFAAAILGIVEGLTEYLPISSTGHLILIARMLGDHGDAMQAFEVVIQLGAILAALVYFRKTLSDNLRGALHHDRNGINLFLCLAIGFAPTGVVAFALHKFIKAHLFGPLPVAGALIVGGLVMIALERLQARRSTSKRQPALTERPPTLTGLENVTPKRAFLIGIGQCFALWPGASRSMCTIVAGRLTGLSSATAAEFSFLLGLPTLGAATLFEAAKSRHELASEVGLGPLAVGLATSFIVALVVMSAFINYLKTQSLAVFGYYRIALGIVVVIALSR